MKITIKINLSDAEAVCQLNKKILNSNSNNEDDINISLNEKMFILSLFEKIKNSCLKKSIKKNESGGNFLNIMTSVEKNI